MSDLLDRIKGTAPASKPDTKSLLARIKGTPVDTLDAAKIANATQRTDVPLPVAAGSKMTLADLPHATPEEAAALRAQDAMIEPTPPPAMSTRIYDAASKALNTVPDAIANVMQTGQTAGEWFMRQPGARRLGLVPGDLTPDQVNALVQGAHESSPATAAVRAVRGARLPEVPGMEESIPGKIATGLGYVGQAVASGGGAIPLGVVEGGSGAFVGTYEQAKARGANEDAAFKAGLAAGGVGAALGGLQMDRLLKINQASGGMLAKALEDAVVFGSVAGAQTALNETITKHATHEDILTLASLEDTAKKAGAEAGIGTIVGALSGAGMHALNAKAATEGAAQTDVTITPDERAVSARSDTPTRGEDPPVRGDSEGVRGAETQVRGEEPVVAPKPEAVVEEPRVVVPEPEVVVEKPGIVVEPTPAEAAPEPSQEPSQASVTPEPPKAEANEPVGLRNSSMDRTAAELGVEPGKRGPKLTDQAAHDEAMRLVKDDPETPRRLISDLEASDRPPNKVEYAVLNIERRRIENERVKARDEYRNATPEEREAKAKRVEEVTAEFNRVKDVFARLGTRSGQSLQARAAMLADDYSLAQMEFELQRAKGDKPLTEADRVEVEQLYERVTKAREAVEAMVADAEVKIAQSEAVRAFERTKRQAARGASRNGRGSIETWIERKANEARERMKARTRTTFAGTDPQLLLDAAYIGADYIAKGVHKFSDWVTAMRADVPELTDADMREVYAHAVKVHEEGKQAVLQAEYDERAAKNPALKAAITRAKNRAAHLFEKAQYGDFSKKERRPLPETPDLVEARTELRRAQKEFERAKRRAERESMSRTAKALDATKQVVGAASDVLTSADVSAVLRQGNIFTLAHPIESGKHIAKMFQAFASEKAAEHIQTIIENDPLYPKLEKAGLDFTGYGDTLSPQEENIRSRLSKYIPFVAQSQRAFVAYMNVQRMARAKAMIEALPDTTPAEIKSIAEFVNDATGRGKLSDPRKDAGLELARLALFSPRLYLSRLNMLTMRPIRRAASPRQRKQAAIELGRYAAGLAAVSGLAWMLGADTEVEDPKKADFGKYRFGDTRLDMTGGLNQYITLAARMGKGETVQANGKTKEQNPVDTFTRFLRNKLNPPVGAAVDLIVGKNAVGEPTDLKDAATRMVVPLSVRDIVETMKSQGIPEGTAISILGLFGAGVQTYGTKK